MLRDKTGTIKEIAKQFKISVNTIAAIKTGRRWGHIKVEGFIEGKNKSAKDCEPLIIKLYKEGVKIKEICLLNSAGSIYDVLNRNNIKPGRVSTT